MKLLIIGGCIGGLVTALSLHQAGSDVEIFEQTQELRELGRLVADADAQIEAAPG